MIPVEVSNIDTYGGHGSFQTEHRKLRSCPDRFDVFRTFKGLSSGKVSYGDTFMVDYDHFGSNMRYSKDGYRSALKAPAGALAQHLAVSLRATFQGIV